MDKLQLALLTAWGEEERQGGIQGRKRMQKVIYFLQQAGCPVDAEYSLHHYGPYSREVANITDIMVAEGLLEEIGGGNAGGQYTYTLSDRTRPMIQRIDRTQSVEEFEAFRDKAVELLEEDLWLLELGSTILYFRSRGKQPNWSAALQKACEYKRSNPENPASRDALTLAQRFGPPDA
ncbi:MAG: hypothetical protein AAGI30_10425 [Planctomycetota bacterium]